jgi:uncharacterized PurR-regulated membrane protein YhhQ (DUF165 family)
VSVALIVCYLAAIVLANLAVGHFGPAALVVTAWVLIPFDLTVKDALQERWTGTGVVLRLGALILAGSILSAALSSSATRIALASFVAFATSGLADSLVLAAMRRYPRLVRVNGSNFAGAVVDSALFQLVAFGTFAPWLFLTQSGAKLLGGFVWSVVLTRTIWRSR